MDNNSNKLDTQQLLAEFKDIPPMPNVMVKALSVIKNPSTGIAELAKIMQVDQAILSKTLSLVNSAFYGFRQQITSIQKALVILGMMKAKNIIMSLALKQMMTAQGSRELWEHSIKCAVAAEFLAKEYKIINPDDAFVIGFLHDIGKIGIPDSILRKEAKLTDDEYSEIKNHPAIGEHILSSAPIFKNIIPIVKHHHEKYDGTGYPGRLKGENIPYLARITAVADTFDAMTSKRSYRDALSLEAVIDEFEEYKGIQFDPKIADVFLNILKNNYEEIQEIGDKYKTDLTV